MPNEKLNKRQMKFCEEYLKHFNGTKAYLAVYTDSSVDAARSSASRLLSDANVIEYLCNISNPKYNIMTPEEVMHLMSETARAAYRDGDRKALAQFSQMIAKHHGLMNDRLEVTHSIDDMIMQSFRDVTEAKVQGIPKAALAEYTESTEASQATKNASHQDTEEKTKSFDDSEGGYPQDTHPPVESE